MKPLYFFYTGLRFRLLYILLPWVVVSQTPQESNEVDALLNAYSSTTPFALHSNQMAALPNMLLYDRTGEYAGLKTFNSAAQNHSSGTHLEQALFEMRKASKHQKFAAVAHYKERFVQQTDYSTSYLGILNTAFKSLNYTTIRSQKAALLYKNDRFQQKDANQPLFNSHEAVVISPFREYFTGSTITLKLSNELLFAEHPTRRLESLELYAENGQYHALMRSGRFTTDAVRIHFQHTGEKTLRFRARFTDGNSVNTQAKIHVKIPKKCERELKDSRIQDFRWTSDISYQGYSESKPIFGELFYRVYYQTQNKSAPLKLKKPIIIIDGFDPLDGRKIEDCDPRDKLSDKDHRSIRDMMKYFKNGEEKDIINELRGLGFDVVVVNHPVYWRKINGKNTRIDGGADYIERNGLNHVSLYKEINRQLKANGSSEKLVIVGPSMGGQISRYALAYMEKNKIDHNTRLWISVDSPHLGANIPLGLQAALNQAKDEIEKAGEFVRDWLGSSAAKQQLIAQMGGSSSVNYSNLDGKTKLQGFKTDRGHSYFKKYYNNTFKNGLKGSKGYPQKTRNIALVNGSLSGNESYYNPFTNKWDSYLGNSVLGANIRSFQRVCIGRILKWRLWCFPVHIGSFEVHSMPKYNSLSKISRFKKAFRDKSVYAKNINPRGNLDNIPGGYFQGFQEVLHGQDGSDPIAYPAGTFLSLSNFFATIGSFISDWLGGAYSEVRENEYVHSFIPSVSAIGYFSPDFNWNTPLNKSNLSCLKQVPFDSYYGESTNTGHTTFNERSMKWFVEELKGVKTSPVIPFSQTTIKGQEVLCSNQTTYKIADNVCDVPAAVKKWSVSSGLKIKYQNNLSVYVSTNGIKTNNYETITAELENGKRLYKQIVVQKPYIFDQRYYSTGMSETAYKVPQCEGLSTVLDREIKGIGFDASSTFEWKKVSGTFTMYTYRNTINIIPMSTRQRTLSYKVRVKGSCGVWSDWRTFNEINPCYDPNPSPGPGRPGPSGIKPPPMLSNPWLLFEIYPNPSSYYVTVNLKSGSNATNKPLTYTLYDVVNRPVKSGVVQGNNNIFVGDVKDGIYLLSLKMGDYEEKQKVIFNRPQAQ